MLAFLLLYLVMPNVRGAMVHALTGALVGAEVVEILQQKSVLVAFGKQGDQPADVESG